MTGAWQTWLHSYLRSLQLRRFGLGVWDDVGFRVLMENKESSPKVFRNQALLERSWHIVITQLGFPSFVTRVAS